MYRESFPSKIKKARNDTGFTQKEVEKETGIILRDEYNEITDYYYGYNCVNDNMFEKPDISTYEKIISNIIKIEVVEKSAVYSGTCGNNIQWILTEDNQLCLYGFGLMEKFVAEENVPWHEPMSLS